MGLTAGTHLGPYEVIAAAGAGGMGEVYRARDTRLNREVAVKVLPAAFCRDRDRLRRFQQEAQAAAALNHPNILAVHDFGEHEGSPYIVTEFLEGETLRERMRAGALPVRKATDYAEQIARGLAAAHEKGIVHRDLKPENIFVTRDGRVKILDFGLAKLTRPEATASPDAATMASQTDPGTVMGTVGYMSPEQVKGREADHRSDLFSFGTILYEMLSGKRAFQRSTSAETMTAILKEEPPVFAASGANIPPLLQQVVNHCLEKDREQRFQSASDLSFALRSLHDASSSQIAAVKISTRGEWLRWARIAAEVALLAVAVILLLSRHSVETSTSRVQAAILPPPGEGFWGNASQPIAISPDGKFLAEIAMHNSHTQLWLRRLDATDAQPIAGSEDADDPFWSPDSRSIAFFGGGKLKKVDISGGTVSDICPVGNIHGGGAWSSRGVIIFANFADVLKRVPENGGTPETIAGTPLSNEALGQYWPVFLPDGKHFLFLEWRYATPQSHLNTVWAGSLDGEKAQRLAITSSNVQYANGHLMYSRDGDLFAQKFDADRLQLSGPEIPVARGIQYDTFIDNGAFTVSSNGVLVYASVGTGVDSELTWMDRNGKTLGVLGQPQHFIVGGLSPDGKRFAVGVKKPGTREKIWIYDADRGTRIPLVTDDDGPPQYSPIWSPDGTQIVYREIDGKFSTLWKQATDGTGAPAQIGTKFDGVLTADDWSPDGRFLSITSTRYRGAANWDDTLQVIRVDGEAKPELEISGATIGVFSPDGHWLAYSDEKSGQVYVTPFPGPGAHIAVSSAGGGNARWRGDGQELFYVADDQTIIAVQMRESSHEFRILSSQPLLRLPLPDYVGFYDVAHDGKRFIAIARTHLEEAAPLTVVTDWTAQLPKEGK